MEIKIGKRELLLKLGKEKLESLIQPEVSENEFTYNHKDYRGAYIVDKFKEGTLPSIGVYAKDIPSAYELAILSVWERGASVGTHYDRKGDPPSKEATVKVHVENAFSEPRISRIYPGGPDDLEVYDQEVNKGIHNNWINPNEGKWTYTYNERAVEYVPSENLKALDRGFLVSPSRLRECFAEAKSMKPEDAIKYMAHAFETGKLYIPPVNQIEKAVLDDLDRDITSKGAQAVIWMPSADPGLESNRPCLQRLWFRVLETEDNYVLNLNSHWRSRDLFKAWFMNVYAITNLQKNVAEKLNERVMSSNKTRAKKPVIVGSYTDISDSLHHYGAYFNEILSTVDKMKKFHMLVGNTKDKYDEGRVYYSDDERFVSAVKEARANLAKDPDYYAKGNR